VFRRLDSFEPSRPGQSHEIFDRAVVFGTTLDLKPITLLQSFDYPGTEQIGGTSGSVHKRRIEASILVLGAHVDALDALLVRKLTLTHTCSSLMMADSGLKQVIWEKAPDTEGRGFDATWREQDAFVAELPDGITIELSSSGSMSPAERSSDGQIVRLSASPRLTLSSEGPRDFQSLWNQFADPLDALIRFASNRSGGWCAATVDSDPIPVQVFHRGLVGRDSGEVPLRHQPTFYLDRLGLDFGRAVESWLSVMEERGPAVQQGLSALGLKTSAEKVRQLAMALEALPDSSTFTSPFRSHWDSIKEAISNAVPAGLRDAAVNRLGGMLQPTLQDRLELLAAGLADASVDVPATVVGTFGDVRAVRNTTSHGNGNVRVTGPQIRRATAAASAMFRTSVLSRLAFDVVRGCQSILQEAADEITRWPE
jgi:hypothetical protein